MEWTRARALFKRGKTIRNLMFQTKAFLLNEGKEEERIDIKYYERRIIALFPDNKFIVSNVGNWRSTPTKERFRRYLPWNGHISSWRFNEFEHALLRSPTPVRVWTLWLSGAGSHPWKNDVVYDSNGHRQDLCRSVNTLDANLLCSKIQSFAKTTIDALMKGDFSLEKRTHCEECATLGGQYLEAQREGSIKRWFDQQVQEHFLVHVLAEDPQLPIATLSAIETGMRHRAATELLLRENRIIWKPTRSQKAIAERMQRLILDPTLANTGIHPPAYRKTLRWGLEKFLLELFGFELGHR